MGLFNKNGFGSRINNKRAGDRSRKKDDDFAEYGIDGNKIYSHTRPDGNSYQFTFGKLGELVYIFDTPLGKKIWYDDVEYCPQCNLPMERDPYDEIWKCDICGYEEPYIPGESCPYVDYDLHEDDYEEYYDDRPESCKFCEGDWPGCITNCKSFNK